MPIYEYECKACDCSFELLTRDRLPNNLCKSFEFLPLRRAKGLGGACRKNQSGTGSQPT